MGPRPQLLSVNVGLPRDIDWNGRTVHKEPVAGRCQVRRLNLDGDGQGDTAGQGGEQRRRRALERLRLRQPAGAR